MERKGMSAMKAVYHLPGLFEFGELYRRFLPLYRTHEDWFYDWCTIGSIYGAPAGCRWDGGRAGFGEDEPAEMAELMREYGISARLTFSNSLLRKEDLTDYKCNRLCAMFEKNGPVPSGVILSSELLLNYLQEKYPRLYFISSTTKVLTEFQELKKELESPTFRYVVPDFRMNRVWDHLHSLPAELKMKIEFLCNEDCWFECPDRKQCYENVCRKNLGIDCPEHICLSPYAQRGYRFSDAMENPGFIGIRDIQDIYLPGGFSHFKIEGRSLGSAVVFEFLLYYLIRPEYQLRVREEIYLSSSLDLF